jgi:putative alpha-1,2-mannosidase
VSLPTVGPVSSVDVKRQRSSFSHTTEQASSGYYAVDLDASKVHAELTATTRTGWARFTYPATGQANVIVDPGADATWSGPGGGSGGALRTFATGVARVGG